MTQHDGHQSFTCTLNGVVTELVGDPAAPATAALRDRGLVSVRETCGLGVCGTCTILLDGEPVSACLTPLFALDRRTARTVEDLEDGGRLSDLQQQFVESQAFQCSFCTPGFLLSGSALLDASSGHLSDDEIEEGLQGHLCRCGCYDSIKEAVRTCASRRASGGGPAA